MVLYCHSVLCLAIPFYQWCPLSLLSIRIFVTLFHAVLWPCLAGCAHWVASALLARGMGPAEPWLRVGVMPMCDSRLELAKTTTNRSAPLVLLFAAASHASAPLLECCFLLAVGAKFPIHALRQSRHSCHTCRQAQQKRQASASLPWTLTCLGTLHCPEATRSILCSTIQINKRGWRLPNTGQGLGFEII